jgi:NTE family protein
MTENNLLRPDPSNPIGLVLSGGGARGAFQVGVWKVLSQDPRGLYEAPSVISGTSAGALNGSLIAAGVPAEEILEFWLDLADNPPVVANESFFQDLRSALSRMMIREPLRGWGHRAREARIFWKLLGKHSWYKSSGLYAMLLEFLLTARFDMVSSLLDQIKTSYLFDTSQVRLRLQKTLGRNTLPKTGVKLAINTVDIRTGGVIRIVNAPPQKGPRASSKHYRYEPEITLDMILASASIPLLFNPVRVGDLDLWDGGLLVNSPMAPAVALGAKRIIPVLVTVEKNENEDPLERFGSAVERLVDTFLENAYNIDRKLLLDRNELATRIPDNDLSIVQLFEAIRPQSRKLFNAGSYLYFERNALLAMYQAGQAAARRWLDQGPQRDSRQRST